MALLKRKSIASQLKVIRISSFIYDYLQWPTPCWIEQCKLRVGTLPSCHSWHFGFWSQIYKQYLQQPTGTTKASVKWDASLKLLQASWNSGELSASLIELVSVLIFFVTVDKSFPSYAVNLVYGNARFATLEWLSRRVKLSSTLENFLCI